MTKISYKGSLNIIQRLITSLSYPYILSQKNTGLVAFNGVYKTSLLNCLANKNKDEIHFVFTKEQKQNETNYQITFDCKNEDECWLVEQKIRGLNMDYDEYYDSLPQLFKLIVDYKELQAMELLSTMPVVDKLSQLSFRDELGHDILHFAATNNLNDLVKQLVEKEQLNCDQANNKGETPLFQTLNNYDGADTYNYELVDYLISKGADINSCNFKGVSCKQLLDKCYSERNAEFTPLTIVVIHT